MKIIFKIYIILLYLFVTSFVRVEAQEVDTSKQHTITHYWFGGEAGLSTFGSLVGITSAFTTQDYVLSFRYSYNRELNVLIKTDNTFHELNVMYGTVIETEFGMLTVSTGLSSVVGTRRGDKIVQGNLPAIYEAQDFATPGIPLDIRLTKSALNIFGGSLALVGNINRYFSFIGVTVSLEFGKF